METQEWITIVNSIGLPAAFLIFLMWGLWRILTSIAPYFLDSYTKHCELIEELKDSVRNCDKNSRALNHAADALDVLAPASKKESIRKHTVAMKEELQCLLLRGCVLIQMNMVWNQQRRYPRYLSSKT